jgi:hypothetical protein
VKASGGRDMNNPMQAEGAAWGNDEKQKQKIKI